MKKINFERKFVLATGNFKKLLEIKRIFSEIPVEILSPKEVGFSMDDVAENGKTFEDNAVIKAEAALKRSGLAAIADDSGLVVEALNGEPGIFSARYAGEGASDGENMQKVLLNLNDNKNRNAKFVCVICCLFKDFDKIIVRGECKGKIGFCPKGAGGFGYDPIFVTSFRKTFAELSQEEKDLISHRGNAIRKLAQIFKKRGEKCL
ncbi:MAG: RdgB/HAM1 family non-canonical purine NTP pyrophosphatase [Oscillospiraceae bacterium]|jgi:XTP/dITP diphosphohydrolase|nr:RdgB/HAM1 family non-canonical purine NTP pyrophosphatase [Oscillospiraceae bacterium]